MTYLRLTRPAGTRGRLALTRVRGALPTSMHFLHLFARLIDYS